MKQQRFALLLVAAILTGLMPIRVLAVTEEADGQETSAVQPLDELTFPLSGDEELTVTWKDAGGTEIYRYNNRGDPVETGSLAGLQTGSYSVTLTVREEGVGLLPGNRYTLDLTTVMQWPPDTGSVVISFPDDDEDGWFEMFDDSGGGEIHFGRLKVTGEGIFTLELYKNEHENLDAWNTHFEFTVTYQGSGEEALPVSVEKTGYYNPETDTIDWSVTTLIPAYTGGTCHTWAVRDSLSYSHIIGDIPGTWEDVKITADSLAYKGEVLPFADSADTDMLAYQLSEPDSGEVQLCFLNRCLCEEGTCQNWTQAGCGNWEGSADWCACWSFPYNTTFTVTYGVDVSGFLQEMEENPETSAKTIENSSRIYQDGKPGPDSTALVFLEAPLRKAETEHPALQNEYAGTYSITVNPNQRYDYSQMDCITITDTMTNLGYVENSLMITGGEQEWIIVTDETQVPSEREGDEDQYCSITEGETIKLGDGRIQTTIQIKIWYPTNLSYLCTYQAIVLDPAAGSTDGYSNTAVLGKEQIEINGTNERPTGDSAITMKNLYISKVDADTRKPLPGAQFGVYLYSGDTEDTLLTTLITDENGSAHFHANRENPPYWVLLTNTLYYFKELKEPEGYQPLTDSFWFYFQEEDGIPADSLPEGVLEHTDQYPEGNLYIEPVLAGRYTDIYITVENEKQPEAEGPEEPDVPEIPEEPEEPDVPEIPEEPGEPDVPEIPEEPDAPEIPEEPEEPKEPETPAVPGGPGRPEEPERPEEPVILDHPDNPDQPAEILTDVPEGSRPQETGSVQTGDARHILPWLGMLLVSLIILFLRCRKKLLTGRKRR